MSAWYMQTVAYTNSMKSALKSVLVLLLLRAVGTQAATTVMNIAAGGDHSLFLKSDGSLWAMGANYYGQLGDGTFNSTNRPEQIVSDGVVAIAAGVVHSLFLKSDGSLWAMGNNFSGQLGDGTFNTTNQPEQIVSSGVVAIAGGVYHSLFLKSDGSLWAMGRNLEGELGDGTFNNTNRPEQIVSSGIVAIAGGDFHSLFLKSDGSLWGMGFNAGGQLGDGTSGDYNYTNRPEQIVSAEVVAIAAGGYHSLFVKSDGSLWAMGYNNRGQIGDGTFNYSGVTRPEQIVTSNVVAIAAGDIHSLFLKSDGSLLATGDNYYGQLGDGSTLNYTNLPEQIVASGVVAISSETQAGHSLFLKSDGSLWAMGANFNGQLGDGFTNSNSSLSEQIVPPPQPVLSISISSRTNLEFKATCQFGGTFYLLSSTNITQPLNQWTRVRTNSVTARGTNNYAATLTNAVSPSIGRRFFVLQSE